MFLSDRIEDQKWHSGPTPGNPDGPYRGVYWEASTDEKHIVAKVFPPYDQISGERVDDAKERADLIAAAPEMFAALECLDIFWLAHFPGGPDEPRDCTITDDHKAVWRKVNAAMAKAKGRSSSRNAQADTTGPDVGF